MGSKSDFLEGKVLDHIYGNTAYTAPATIYIALYTVTPSDSGGGTEVAGGSYARAAVANNTTNFPNATSGSKSNGTDITFTTATGNWGTVVAWAAFDASSGGNMLHWGDITPAKAINTADTAKVTTGSMTITED